jgi:hypothetical protein
MDPIGIGVKTNMQHEPLRQVMSAAENGADEERFGAMPNIGTAEPKAAEEQPNKRQRTN